MCGLDETHDRNVQNISNSITGLRLLAVSSGLTKLPTNHDQPQPKTYVDLVPNRAVAAERQVCRIRTQRVQKLAAQVHPSFPGAFPDKESRDTQPQQSFKDFSIVGVQIPRKCRNGDATEKSTSSMSTYNMVGDHPGPVLVS